MKKNIPIIVIVLILLLMLVGISLKRNGNSAEISLDGNTSVSDSQTVIENAIFTKSDLFTNRDLEQEADTAGAVRYTLTDEEDIRITEEGVYIITGTAQNATIYVEAPDDAKVQLVLNQVSISNDDFPCIYVKSADKVFVTTASSENALIVSGQFVSDESTNTDGVIFSRSDIVLNGKGTLTISSTDNGVVGKDDVKITGGSYQITASSIAIRANDSTRIADGTLTLKAGTDGLHAENSSDDSLGYIYIGGGKITVQANDDAVHGNSVVQIDDGEINLQAAEGIEATYVQINGGTSLIEATDDGINAGRKSNQYNPTIEMNGGSIKIEMKNGDTDGVDSNGDIIVNGGTIEVTGSSTFDYDGRAEFNGGTIIVNGTEVDTIPNQMMGGQRGRSGINPSDMQKNRIK